LKFLFIRIEFINLQIDTCDPSRGRGLGSWPSATESDKGNPARTSESSVGAGSSSVSVVVGTASSLAAKADSTSISVTAASVGVDESIGGDGRGDDGLSEDDGDPIGENCDAAGGGERSALLTSVFSLRVARTDVMDFISAFTSACVQTPSRKVLFFSLS
jgi:hypothetical protein